MMIAEHEVIPEAAIAVVAGEPVTEIPSDLFIPPDALEVLLDCFTGPLDLLLYLIRKQNIDILNIPMTIITQQYMQYIELLEQRRMELAADYLVMAALLAEIKSKLLLPLSPSETEDIEEDPRMELVRRLQAYEQFKEIASRLDDLSRLERDTFPVTMQRDSLLIEKTFPELELSALVAVMQNLMKRQQHLTSHQIERELLSVRERMTSVLNHLQQKRAADFTQLLTVSEGRMGLVVTFLAILELARQSLLTITQATAYSRIHLQAN